MAHQVVIVGGGVHGSCIAANLIKSGIDDILILDKQPCLSNWMKLTGQMGMTELRSSNLGHIAPIGDDGPIVQDTTQPLNLSIFNKHSKSVLDKYGLEDLRMPIKATGMVYNSKSKTFTISTSGHNKGIQTHYLIYAIGLGEPFWGQCMGPPTRRVIHAEEFNVNSHNISGNICIIGGGESGAKIALELNKYKEIKTIDICSKKLPCVMQLETDAKYLPEQDWHVKFLRQPKDIKVAQLAYARSSKPITPKTLKSVLELPKIAFIHEDIKKWELVQNRKKIRLNPSMPDYDYVIVCAGWRPLPMNSPEMSNLFGKVSTYQNRILMNWDYSVKHREVPAGKLFVSGILAEMTGGPFSRNVIGARHSAKVITETLLSTK